MGRLAVTEYICPFATAPARINIVGKTFAKHFEMQFSPTRCPPSTKSGVGVYDDRGSSWPQVTPACPLTLSPHSLHPVQLFGRLSWLKTRLKQAKWAQIAHETEPSWRLPDHPDGVGPPHHPSLHCPHHEDDFYLLQCLILTFLVQDMLL